MNSFKFAGPPLSEGPLPAIFYFALSADESLTLDPFNQPVAYLSNLPIRIFSVDLPGHGKDLPATQALEIWADEISKGHNIIQECIDQIERLVENLLKQNVLISNKIATMGLSRGAFIATLAAAQIPHFQSILGFAPLTRVSSIKEFQTLEHSSLIESLNLEHFIEKLGTRPLRFYIGNIDVRVGTRNCFNFIEKLSSSQLEKKVRSPQVELIISPSIGFQGHGTSKAIFHQGARWIAEKLGCIDVV